MATAADKNKKTAAKENSGGRSKLLLIAIAAVVVVGAAAGGAAWYFAGRQSADAQAAAKAPALPAPAQYFAMDPPFVVNLNGPADGPRYLQVEVQLMTRDAEALKSIEANAPAIRAALLMLFSQVDPAAIADRAGKEKLQKQALAEVQARLKAETGKPCADDLLFTSFVTQ
ncbi:flagellar basal body-associated FliL family protein [Stenotrophomonas sp. MMGLT7]|uniref:flagellar basal body-associated FliL family protein n=1 Tax=Stenotrophomonas sp. MMGLT7 TaxID=2901227 RepID=UPI001E4E97B1|nr:flagellar basal body-associated FliL family protein [Stenotrophomonas sp. MMGLT7]